MRIKYICEELDVCPIKILADVLNLKFWNTNRIYKRGGGSVISLCLDFFQKEN